MIKRIYIDMDGVLCDFDGGKKNLSQPNDLSLDKIPNYFKNLQPIKNALSSVNKLMDDINFDVYILSTAPWDNPSSWTDKRLWIENHFGDKLNRRLILSHRKDFLKGDYLIDDRPNNGAKEFEGKWIHFGSSQFPNWDSILKYLQ